MHPMLKANARAILWFPGLPDGSAALEAEEMVICIVDAENLKETKKKNLISNEKGKWQFYSYVIPYLWLAT